MMRSFTTVALICVCMFTACTKDDSAVPTKKATNISADQAAKMIATSLAQNSYGLVSVKNDVTFYARSLGSTTGKGCGIVDSFAVAKQEFASSNINYNYAIGYHYTVNCEAGLQDNLSSNTTYNGSFDAATLTSINSSATTLNIMQMADKAAVNYDLNGNYQSNGTFQTLDETKLEGSNAITININNLLIKKTDRAVVSGSANVSLSGTIKSNKNTFAYEGIVIFNDASTATLALGDAKYLINLITAEVTAL